MQSQPANSLIRHIRKLAGSCEAGQPDAALLQEFISRQDAAAFAALVERHGPLVLSVARRILREWHAAEDVFQATFLVLARKAGSIRKHTALGSWLYGVAYRLAKRARVEAARRHAQESQILPRSETDPYTDTSWREVCGVLDEELQRLPQKLRAPLVLCYLEAKTRDEAAHQLGWSLRTLHRRLERGQSQLRTRLLRRGVKLSLSLLVTALTQSAVSGSLSPGLVEATAQIALPFAAGQTTAPGVPAAILALAQRGIYAMEIAKLKTVTACVMGLAILATGAGLAGYRVWAARALKETPPAADQPVSAGSAQRTAPKEERRVRAAGLLREAYEALAAAEGGLRHRALADVAVLQTRLGEAEETRKTFAKARQVADEDYPGDSRYGEWRELSRAHARAGEAEEVLALVEAIPADTPTGQGKENQFRNMVLQEAATELAKIGLGKEALGLVERITDETNRPWIHGMILTDLALWQAKKGKLDAALRTLESMPDPLDKIQTLTGVVYYNLSYTGYPHQSGLALIQIKAGDRAGARKSLQRALALLPEVKDETKQARARSALVCAQVKLGELAAAVRTAKAIQKPEWQAVALGAIAHGQARAGQSKAALETIESLADKEARVHGLYQMALGQTQAGDRKAARKTLEQAIDLAKILPEQPASLHFHNIASVQAVAGDFQGALATAKEFLQPQSIVFANIAHEQAKAGDLKGAMETAQFFEEGAWWQGNAYRDMARVLVQSGKEKEAVAWAKDLPASLLQGNALLGAAEGLIMTDGTE